MHVCVCDVMHAAFNFILHLPLTEKYYTFTTQIPYIMLLVAVGVCLSQHIFDSTNRIGFAVCCFVMLEVLEYAREGDEQIVICIL